VQPQLKGITPEEYFQNEAKAVGKSEYYHGEVFAMTGASVNHNLISTNIIARLVNSLIKPCLVFPGDIKVEIDKAHHYVYPDVSVVCEQIEYGAGRDDVILNPTVIFEILSESTKDYDRGSKFAAYRRLDSLVNYIIIDQYSIQVENFTKKGNDVWELTLYHGLEDRLVIPSIHVSLGLNEIYKHIEHP